MVAPLGLLLGAGVVLASVAGERGKGLPRRAKKSGVIKATRATLIPGQKKYAGPGLVIYGPGGTWNATYMKSEGCKNLRWGVCFKDFIEKLREDPDAPDAVATVEKVALWVARLISPQGAAIAEWITKNVCVRFKWPLRRYKDADGVTRYAILFQKSIVARLMEDSVPPFPANLPPRDGYKRVWVSGEHLPSGLDGATAVDNSIRSDKVLSIFWPRSEQKDDVSIYGELLDRTTIRALLRMDYRVEGALDAKRLAEYGCDKSKWWMARRSKAMEEFA